ncbi:MAG: CPBP family intramembrane glutamic endopeptidase [Parvibaculum sp.]|uniref:CPBP family intramembrane glutamic endopeptidase n=1 Tax=Parvibaculum sp. TaxID=2024848 RepID=UPI0034A0664E
MDDTFSILLDYNARMAPGMLVFTLCLVLLPLRAVGIRIALYIAIFILVRDAMTPVGLWNVEGLRIGFYSDGAVLALLGISSVLGVAFLWFVERDMRALLVWQKGNLGAGLAAGLGAGLVIGLGAMSLSGFSPRLTDFAPGFVAGLVVLVYGGNLLEEVLFRGYLQGRLETYVTPVRAALLSGLIFAACHSYLALTVTDAGWSILAFTAVEGIACGFVRLRYGIWAAALTHGTAILLIAMPMM